MLSSKLSHRDIEMLTELRRNERSLWDVTSPHYSNARLARFLFLLGLLLAATLRWFTAGGAIRIAVRQLSQTWKLRHYDVIGDVGNYKR